MVNLNNTGYPNENHEIKTKPSKVQSLTYIIYVPGCNEYVYLTEYVVHINVQSMIKSGWREDDEEGSVR